jgi:hypothetical protein
MLSGRHMETVTSDGSYTNRSEQINQEVLERVRRESVLAESMKMKN